ncbi:hypothetical protein HH310_30005 [Actinoplanes sp. TBRC 11911]|uniref:hypothetical protein n=1 Tax=Actinoplanes sp. TBRC 11911 TaxID=2729386 RepID=UPI00145F805E|nr:hypothetical protein [Actinoplanes sp. TBRC 11911]NMO55404.1 hypothetical protein [Actinoplanes sp. TBRC 11911]
MGIDTSSAASGLAATTDSLPAAAPAEAELHRPATAVLSITLPLDTTAFVDHRKIPSPR